MKQLILIPLIPLILLELLALLVLCPVSVSGRRNNGSADNSIYPIGSLQSSLTASEGQGIVVAVQSSSSSSIASSSDDKDNDFVVIVSHSPVEANCNLTRSFLTSSKTTNNDDNTDNNHHNNHHNHGQEENSSNKHKSKYSSVLHPIAFRGAVTRSYSNQNTNTNTKTKTNNNNNNHHHHRHLSSKRTSRTLHILQEQVGICLAMTGFVSDVKHLVRYVANVISEYEYLYGGSSSSSSYSYGSSSSSSSPTIHSLVRDTLASYMRDATTLGGSRPFGVQALVVGNDNDNNNNNRVGSTSSGSGSGKSNLSKKIQIYTLDPTGNFRHCIGGVATIGKNAELVRQSLCKALQLQTEVVVDDGNDGNGNNNDDTSNNNNNDDNSIEHYLDIAIQSILENMIRMDDHDIDNIRDYLSHPLDKKGANQFEAIVVFGNANANANRNDRCYSCAVLDNDSIIGSYRKGIKAIIQKNQSIR